MMLDIKDKDMNALNITERTGEPNIPISNST